MSYLKYRCLMFIESSITSIFASTASYSGSDVTVSYDEVRLCTAKI